MKKLSILVAVTCLALAVWILWAVNHPRYNAYGAVKQIWAEKYRTQRDVAELEPKLKEAIKADPERVLVYMVVLDAKEWPGISQEDEERILTKAEQNSGQAIEDLKRVLNDNVVREMRDGGYNPDKEIHASWHNNNRATALIFCYYPKAKSLGRTAEFVEWKLEGSREGRTPFWYD